MADGKLIESISKQAHEDLEKFVAKLNEGIEATSEWAKIWPKIKLPSDVAKGQRQTVTALNDMKKAVADYEKQERSLHGAQKRRMQSTSSINRETQKLRQESNQMNRITRTQVKLTSQLFSEYDKLDASLSLVGRKYRALLVRKEQGEILNKKEEARLKRLGKLYDQYRGTLDSVDQKMKNWGRNVGNYASHWDGLGFSIQQLTREAPAFANSMQTGFMAISNNIPMLVDEINRLRVANKALAAEGKPTQSIFKALSTALFSWQTALSAGILLLTLYGDEMFKFVSGLFKSSSALKASADAQKEYEKALIDTTSQIVTERVELGALLKIAQDETQSREKRNQAVKILQDRYPKYLKNLDLEKVNSEEVAKAIDKITESLSRKAKMQAAENLLSEQYKTLLTEVADATEIAEQLSTGYVSKQVKNYKQQIKGLEELIEKNKENVQVVEFAQNKITELRKKMLSDSRTALENSFISDYVEGETVEAKAKYERFVKILEDIFADAPDLFDLLGDEGGSGKGKNQDYFFERQKERYNRIIQLIENVATNEEATIAARIKANELLVAKQNEFAKLIYENELKNAGKNAEERKLIEEKYVLELQRIRMDNEKRVLAITKQSLENQRKLRKDTLDDLEKSIIESNNKDLDNLKRQYINREITIQQYEEREKKLKLEAARTLALAKLKLLEKQVEAETKAGENTEATLEAIRALQREILNIDFDLSKLGAEESAEGVDHLQSAFMRLGETIGIQGSTIQNIFDALKKEIKDTGELAVAFGALFSDITASMAASENERIEQRIAMLAREKETAIAFAGDSAAAREEIQQRYQEKERELRQRQAENRKKAAIVQAVIDTAAAVVNTLANVPAPGNVLYAALVGALGAAQIAIIASQKVPQFKDGKRNFKGGPAILGDGGKREPYTDRHGNLIGVSPDTPTLVDLPPGANVFKDFDDFNKELNRELSANDINPLGNAVYSGIPRTSKQTGSSLDEAALERVMKKTIGKQPIVNVQMDKSGVRSFIRNQSQQTEILDNRISTNRQDHGAT